MDKRPIGVFDSGLGGLTAVRALRQLLPREDIVYFGDTGRVPYGTRSDETIVAYARQDMNFLLRFRPKCVLVACGTVSTVALETLQREYTVPIEGVVDAAVLAAAAATRNGCIGVIGTPATIRSGKYERQLRHIQPGLTTVSQACPLLVPLVENGRTEPGDMVVTEVVTGYLAPIRAAGADTLILGCTHYPLLSGVIRCCMGEQVRLISPGAEAAGLLRHRLKAADAEADPENPGSVHCYVTDGEAGFEALAERFLGERVQGCVERVSLLTGLKR